MLVETSLGAFKALELESGVVPPHLASLRLFHLGCPQREDSERASSLGGLGAAGEDRVAAQHLMRYPLPPCAM